MSEFRVTVYGTAQPAGSKRAFKVGEGVAVTDANPKSRLWKLQVAQVAGEAMNGRDLMRKPLFLSLTFYVARLKGHFKKNGDLSAQGRRNPYPAKRPDLLKLARGVEDALSGVVYGDDAQIVTEVLNKCWGEPARVDIVVSEYSDAEGHVLVGSPNSVLKLRSDR